MKFLLSLCTLLITIASSQSQNIKILEKLTNLPVAGAVIFNDSKVTSTTSDIDGVVSLDMFSFEEVIYVEHLLYQTSSLKVSEIVNKTIFLTSKIEGLDEIVISASKFQQNKRDIPQKIISISAKSIAFSNPQTSADVLEGTGNVFIQKSQMGGGSPMIRGLSTNRLLITVDGVRMNNAIFRGGNLQNVISIDPFIIHNTEVTLGAGSVVYGSDALGGVMSFYTQKPQLSSSDSLYFKGNAVARYASANKEKTGHIDVNFGLKKWAFLTSVSFTDFDNLRMGSYGPIDYIRPEYVQTVNGSDVVVPNENPLVQVPTGYDQINFLQKVHYEPRENWTFDLGLYYTTTSDYARYDRLIRYKGDNLRSAVWNYGPQRWFMGNLQVTKLSSNSNLYDKIQATVAYQNFQESRMDRDFNKPDKNIREEAVDALSANLDLEKQLGARTELFYGLEYIYNKVTSTGIEEDVVTGILVPTISRYPNGSDWQSVAAYSSLKFKPNPKFVLQTGIRYNQVIVNADFTENNVYLNLPYSTTKINTGAFTGTAGVNWNPNEMLGLKLNASSAFRAPNIDDIGKVFDSEPGSVVVPNDNLKPEYAYGLEFGVKLNFENSVILDMATYYTFLDHTLVRRDFTLNGDSEIVYDGQLSNVQAIQNAAESRIYGFEVRMLVKVTDALKLKSHYNIIGGKEQDDAGETTPLRHAAPQFGATHLVWQKDKLQLDAFANYNSELSNNQLAPSEQEKGYMYALDANGKPYSPSWYTLNLRTQYQFNAAVSLTASLENITDQRYRPYSSGISAAGRNLIIALKYTL
ncbi:hemoglobin/transferrin/lactoferrin receptor protein [Gelidibacter algens]|uniref:Hemoglobin/transferrin/lactoferrin receptor protein n=1 Tax=Gelidibacter algens TaxID=49280 RepID=A0A1A7R5R0_9FLAO|nr:TonB-dependent receptor [Gelidibacter algens]OBX26087.1 TonB-dependent receptor [Gelidibacter algens]RAJ22955.1 hemoglobin/transferrin/lactoferrin receptor protein [Gelidibacter algens]